MTSLRDALAAIQDEHHGWAGDVIECQCPDRPVFPDTTSHARHVADLQVAYLRKERDAALERVRAIGERLKSQEGQRVANWNAVLGQEILSALEAR